MAVASVILVSIMHRHARQLARKTIVHSEIKALAVQIEMYRQDNNEYPRSLEALAHEPLERLRDDGFCDKYDYKRLTNGFAITVTGPASRFYTWDTVVEEYGIGDALK